MRTWARTSFPYVPPGENPPELTVRALLLGALLSIVFGMVNAYLGLRVGLTVSASIPSAVISMAVFRALARRGSILENNLVHTVASTGESLAAGVVFTLPALLFLGWAPDAFEVSLFGATAAVLGICAMIPLRHRLTIERHDELPFPEGTACAHVLVAGDRGGEDARPVFAGIAAGGLYALLGRGLGLWRETVFASLPALHKASIGFELSPVFLGVGVLVGPRIAWTLFAGGALGWTVLIPLFDAWGAGASALGAPPELSALDAFGIWNRAVRYVGAGAVAAGGALSMIRALPAMRAALANLRRGLLRPTRSPIRTERDLPAPAVVSGFALAAAAIWLVPAFRLTGLDALFAVAFAVFFVIVSAEIVGLVGTTSQPVSGMTITALLVTAFGVLASGRSGSEGAAAAIRVGAIVAIAISLAGDMSQDLKTGALLGATPRALQIGEIFGAAIAALRVGWVLLVLHRAYGLGSAALPAPQAKLMATLASGVMHGDLPWGLLGLGAAVALAAEGFGISSLPFAIGLYLPITTSAGLLAGGLLGGVLCRNNPRAADPTFPSATLLASGLVAGDALTGIGLAVLAGSRWATRVALRSPGEGLGEIALTLAVFAALTGGFLALARRPSPAGAPRPPDGP